MNGVQRLVSIASKSERLVLGLMSGMSHDGLDMALVRVRDTSEGLHVELEAHETVAYDAGLRERLRASVVGSTREVCLLSFELAEHWSAAVLAFLASRGVAPDTVDALGSHGQTLDHVPRGRGRVAATLQVGDGDVLAERTGILTVSDFRCRDVAAGGEGAPLVPFADWLLYARPGQVIACQNLGSIGNVTVVTERADQVTAFDTGPANALIDAFARRATGQTDAIDEDGRLSAAGRVRPRVLAALAEACGDFLSKAPPKSAGYDEFAGGLAGRIARALPGVAGADFVRTAVEFTAETLATAYAQWVVPDHPTLARMLLTGGGAHNPTLVASIRARVKALGLEVEVPEGRWIDAKEAVAFALLADATVRGRASNLPGATGARRSVVLGKISL